MPWVIKTGVGDAAPTVEHMARDELAAISPTYPGYVTPEKAKDDLIALLWHRLVQAEKRGSGLPPFTILLLEDGPGWLESREVPIPPETVIIPPRSPAVIVREASANEKPPPCGS